MKSTTVQSPAKVSEIYDSGWTKPCFVHTIDNCVVCLYDSLKFKVDWKEMKAVSPEGKDIAWYYHNESESYRIIVPKLPYPEYEQYVIPREAVVQSPYTMEEVFAQANLNFTAFKVLVNEITGHSDQPSEQWTDVGYTTDITPTKADSLINANSVAYGKHTEGMFFYEDTFKQKSFVEESFSGLSKLLPAMEETVTCPLEGMAFPTNWDNKYFAGWSEQMKRSRVCTTKSGTLWSVVQHLNDQHKMTREDIADWIRLLPIDTTFKTPEGDQNDNAK